ncbi:hypothetical protein QQP08_024121 [Theobroma cacao]|nr:hypothetical protein QQP08_024121 [Theobroma cacao]
MTIEEYETRFNELMSYIPKLVRLEQDQVNYFEEGLYNEIRERMIVTGKESYKEVVQMALRAKKLATERIDRSEPRNTTSTSVASTRPPSQQSQPRFSRFDRLVMSGQRGTYGGLDRCRNCGGFHGTVATFTPPTRPSILRRDTSGSQSRQGPMTRSGMGSNTPKQPSSRSQPQILTRVFAVTEDEARVRPSIMTGTMIVFDRDAHVLIDSGFDRSYVSISFASCLDRNLSSLEEEIIVHTPLGE